MNLKPVEIKALLPARDFAASKAFYERVGFRCAFSDGEIAYFHIEHCSFLLQNAFDPAAARVFEMHWLVESADDWHRALTEAGLGDALGPLVNQPWAMREFLLTDPSGLRWRVAHNLPRPDA